MKIVNSTTFNYAHSVGRLTYPGYTLTLIVKGTFDLKNGKASELSEEQLYPSGDEFYPDDENMTGSLRYENDFAFFKPRTDILLTGHCYSLGGKPVPANRVTFVVGSHLRTLYVFGDRKWKGLPGMRFISDPELFTNMALRYENSFGGPGYEKNPVGKGYNREINESGANEWPLPNIEDPENLVVSPDSCPEPAGYGPLGKMWKPRLSKMGTYDANWKIKRWPWFPENLDWSHFNAAPANMQMDGYLQGDESLYFENMHPEHPRYQSKLPGFRVRCFLQKLTEPDSERIVFGEVKMRLDTLWADMDAEKLILVWRGSAEVLSEDFEEVQNVFIMSEKLDTQPASTEKCYENFLAAQETEAKEFDFEPEKPQEPVTAVAGMAVPGVAAVMPSIAGAVITEEELPREEEVQIDPVAIKEQAKELLLKNGLNINNLTAASREKIDQEIDKVIADMSERDYVKITENQQKKLESQLNQTFAQLGIDTDNLPPVSEKARQEQIRMLQELGLNDAENVFQHPDLSKIMNSLMALYPIIGHNPENLTPLIEIAMKQKNIIDKQKNLYSKESRTEKSGSSGEKPES